MPITKYSDLEHSKGEQLVTMGIHHHADSNFDVPQSIVEDNLLNIPGPLFVLSLQQFGGFCLNKHFCR